MTRGWISTGASFCAAAVVAGAFGAHTLRPRVDAHALGLWETAARYLFYGGVGVVLLGLASLHGERRGLGLAGASLVAGTLVFSGTVGALALGGPRWLGAVTPIGGLLLIAGFLVFGWAMARG